MRPDLPDGVRNTVRKLLRGEGHFVGPQVRQGRGTGSELRWLRSRLLAAGVSKGVVAAMMTVPREEFVPPYDRSRAYDDWSLPIGHGQTISQPTLVGKMIDDMEPGPEHVVLDIGTGSGYQAAILSRLVKRVVSVERVPALASAAAERLKRLGFDNIELHLAGAELGWPEDAPYDGTVVGAAAPEVPETLVQQLKIGGKLVMPVGTAEQQDVYIVTRTETGRHIAKKTPVRFVPLIGKGAFAK